jgi:hypothetical protein
LTTTIPPLNASVSNPNLTNTKISNRELSSNQKVKELAIRYKELGTGEYPPEFKNFLNTKRQAYKNYATDTKSIGAIWYPSDIEVAEKNGLPKNWMLLVDLEKESNKKVEELAIKFTELGGKYPREFKSFLSNKRAAYRAFIKGIKSTTAWYPSDIEVAEKNGLPNNWMNPQIETIKNKNEQKSNDRFKDIAIYYGRNGSAPSAVAFNKENKSLGKWLEGKKSRNNPYEESDNKTWADMVELSKSPNWIDPVTEEPFKHSPLPDNWREIEPAGEKSLGEKLVLNILTELKIKNDPQHRGEACFNKRCLPFDFSITHNGKKYLLEYNGKQHYYPSYFGLGEDKTKQEIAKDAIEKFEYTQGNDTIKYDHCEREKIPFLVIPYWLYKKPDIIKNTIIEFLKTNEFNETFADPVVPQNYKAYHDKMYAKYLAESNPIELVEPTKTFEQFLINKNFINI